MAFATRLGARSLAGRDQVQAQRPSRPALSHWRGSWRQLQAVHANGNHPAASGSSGSGSNSSDSIGSSRVHLNGEAGSLKEYAEMQYLTGRANQVNKYFNNAMGVDDFVQRLEIALWAYGIHSENSIAMVNLCRDEVTHTLKHKIDQVFGSSFSTSGLGGVLTCGMSGVAAGLSHSPISTTSGKERYVFFSFPHISIDAKGHVGSISRPGRSHASCACGALNKALVDIKAEGLTPNCKQPGVHEPLDIEFSILKQRLARRLRFEGHSDASVDGLDLVSLTKLAERTITDDLEFLIAHTVDKRRADYAVVTGVQIHNWGEKFDDDSPNLEFVAPTSVYVVVNGEKTHLDLSAVPSLTPRQIRLLASAGPGGHSHHPAPGHDEDAVCNSGGSSTLREIDPPYMYHSRAARRRMKERLASYAHLLAEEGLQPEAAMSWPSWQSNLRAAVPHRHEDDSSVVIDQHYWSSPSDTELEGGLYEAWGKAGAARVRHAQSREAQGAC